MGYRIKTISEMTGIQRATLLAWERRYRLVSPVRHSNGYREYSEQDLARLMALKRLLDRGYKVSEAISLMHGGVAPPPARADAEGPPVGFVALHDSIQQQRDASGEAGPRLLRACPDLPRLLNDPDPEPPDVVVARLSLLGPDPVSAIRSIKHRYPECPVIVVHEFATRRVLDRLARLGVRLLQGPSRLGALHTLVEEAVGRPADPAVSVLPALGPEPHAEVPAPRFNDEQLGQLRELRTGLDCECPNHLASIVTALRSFEQYSRSCETADERDQALHAWLTEGSGRARALVEDLLLRVCEQERISL